jgi:hypothetical protein
MRKLAMTMLIILQEAVLSKPTKGTYVYAFILEVACG